MDKNTALVKIKKCLALAASSNPHEAAAAMRQAQKLMEAHGLTEKDVSLADVTESSAPSYTASLVKWEAALSRFVADAFGCDVYFSRNLKLEKGCRLRRDSTYVFVGVGAAAEVAGYAYAVLSRQCGKDRRAHVTKQPKNCKPKTKVARGDLFAEGWVHGVREKLDKFAGNEGGLELVQQYMAQKNMRTGKAADRTTGKNVNTNDWHGGLRAGSAARLDRGIGGQDAQGLLTG